MSKGIGIKVAVVTMLVGAAFVRNGPPTAGFGDRLVLGILAIGIFNILVAPPGTLGIRSFGVICSVVGLLFQDAPRAIAVMLLWLVWPPAYMVAWSRQSERFDAAVEPTSERSPTAARGALAAIIAAVAFGYLAYKGIFANQLQQTAALFIGIPSLLAIVVVLFVSPRSAKGAACKAVTVGLLASLVFLGEGMLCILMSAPIFYGVAIGIGAAADAVRLRERGRTAYSCVILLMLVPMSFEGVTHSLSFNRNETVTATRVVRVSARDVQQAVFEPPRFDRALPVALRIGFPWPTSARIEDGSTRWIIRMRGGEMRLDGMEPRAGDLVLELEEARPGLVRWRAISDDSHMTHFLSWQYATVEWKAIDAQTTAVTWTLHYRRGLDPSWYFGPWERYVATMAAEYLIDSVATP
jgi:hypothetical protein